jgi:hypothetical protein
LCGPFLFIFLLPTPVSRFAIMSIIHYELGLCKSQKKGYQYFFLRIS